VNEVREGFECGVGLDGWDDIEVGDVLETFASERV
jgi:translation initiation factor IF-2